MGCTVQSMLRSGRSVRILGCEVHSRGRTPHGVRGLKSIWDSVDAISGASHPSRGAWIEICVPSPHHIGGQSHPSRGAWIEIQTNLYQRMALNPSHPSRGAWIEICESRFSILSKNKSHPSRGAWIEISQDDSNHRPKSSHPSRGAWIEILRKHDGFGAEHVSHPSRGAWIEIRIPAVRHGLVQVAPLTGCVD